MLYYFFFLYEFIEALIAIYYTYFHYNARIAVLIYIIFFQRFKLRELSYIVFCIILINRLHIGPNYRICITIKNFN